MKYGILFLIFFWLPCAVGCNRPASIKPSGNTIKIGVLGPFSGSTRAVGEDGVNGIHTVMNMHPLLENGDKIELVIEDDKNEPILTVKKFKKLITEENVSAILLFSGSSSSLAVNAIADNYQVPVLVLLGSHPDIAKGKVFVSQLSFDDTFQGRVAALFVRDELLIDNVAVFRNSENLHSSSLAEEFVKKFEAIGGTVTANIQMEEDQEDIKSVLESLQKKKTKFLYLPVGASDFIRISKSLKNSGWAPERMCGDGLSSSVLRQYPEEIGLLEGIYDIDMYTSSDEGTTFGKQATKIYRKLFSKKATTFTAVGAEGYAILQDAMNRCAEPADRQCINTMLHNTDVFEGLLGRIFILSDGKAERPLIVNRVRKGRLQYIVKVY